MFINKYIQKIFKDFVDIISNLLIHIQNIIYLLLSKFVL